MNDKETVRLIFIEFSKLHDRLAEEKKDAERYRWLKKQQRISFVESGSRHPVVSHNLFRGSMDSVIDAGIDAARGQHD